MPIYRRNRDPGGGCAGKSLQQSVSVLEELPVEPTERLTAKRRDGRLPLVLKGRRDGLVDRSGVPDDAVDALTEQIFRELLTFMMEDPRTISSGIDVAFAAKAIERVGDHAKNIAEATVYVAKGADIRHATAQQRESAVR